MDSFDMAVENICRVKRISKEELFEDEPELKRVVTGDYSSNKTLGFAMLLHKENEKLRKENEDLRKKILEV